MRDAGIAVSLAYVVANEDSSLHIYVRVSGAGSEDGDSDAEDGSNPMSEVEGFFGPWRHQGLFTIDSGFYGTHEGQMARLLHDMGCTPE